MNASQENKPKSKQELAGEILAQAIEKKGITQRKLGIAAKISTKQLQNYISGKFPKHKSTTVEKLDGILGTKLCELLYEKNIPAPEQENPVPEDQTIDVNAMYRQQAKLQELLLDEISKMNFNLNRLTLIAAGRTSVSKEEADFLLSELDKKKNVAKFPFEDLIEKGEKEGNSHAVGNSGNS